LPVVVDITTTRPPMTAENVAGTLPVGATAPALVPGGPLVLAAGGRVVAVVEGTAGPGLVAGGCGGFTVGVVPRRPSTAPDAGGRQRAAHGQGGEPLVVAAGAAVDLRGAGLHGALGAVLRVAHQLLLQ
jgi:hypothetical protein